MELPADEKSSMWQTGVLFYSIATPMVIAVPIMYGLFWEKMIKGEVCQFYSLTTQDYIESVKMTANQMIEYCVANYDNGDAYQVGGLTPFDELTGSRLSIFKIALFLPCLLLLIEFFLNQLLVPKRNFFLQIVVSVFYMLVTMAATSQDKSVFPDLVNFGCEEEGCKWSSFFLFHLVFMAMLQVCFWLLVGLHFMKIRFCCRKSVAIIQQPVFVVDSTLTSKSKNK